MFAGLRITRRGRIVVAFLAVLAVCAVIYGIAIVTSIPPVPVADGAWDDALAAARARAGR